MTDPLDELAGLRALGARLGPSQALRTMRRGGYETLEHRSAGPHLDAGMLARHEYLTAQRSGGDADLLRRRRELRLLELGAS